MTESAFYSAEELHEYREIFSLFDRHHTGEIHLNELGLLIRSSGFHPSENRIRHIRNAYEENQIETIDFQQFLQIVIDLTNEIEDEIDIIEAFRVFDKEGQGFISKEELMYIMTHLGEKFSMEEAEEMIHDGDIYSDGKIRYEEFVKVMTQLN